MDQLPTEMKPFIALMNDNFGHGSKNIKAPQTLPEQGSFAG
jgi:hypothetical protein